MRRDPADTIEDLEFLDQNGVGAVDAAARLDFTSADALNKWLRDHDRWDLWLSLKRRDPEGTHKNGTDRKKERLMSVATNVDPIAALLADAAKSNKARTRNRANKIQNMVDDLRAELQFEREDSARKEAARKEVQRLERALADAKAQLRGGSTSIAVDGSVSAAELRAWASANGIECPERGRVPQSVRDAYEDSEQVAS